MPQIVRTSRRERLLSVPRTTSIRGSPGPTTTPMHAARTSTIPPRGPAGILSTMTMHSLSLLLRRTSLRAGQAPRAAHTTTTPHLPPISLSALTVGLAAYTRTRLSILIRLLLVAASLAEHPRRTLARASLLRKSPPLDLKHPPAACRPRSVQFLSSRRRLILSLGRPCAACGKAMQGAFVRALGAVYHLQCFKCMVSITCSCHP